LTIGPTELPDLRGRVAIVTGGSRGIGLAAATALAQAGARLALVARDEQALAAARASLAAYATPLTITGSVEDHAFCARAAAQVESSLGPIAILVNAAGIQGPIGPLHTLAPAEAERAVRVNLFGTMWMMQATLPRMAERGAGAIVNLSGGGATGPRENFTPYAASKAAVVRVTEIAALEYASRGVRVNAVAPGAVNTRMTDEVEAAGERAGDKARDEVRKQRASGGTDPMLAARLIAWLASDAAAHVNGKLVSAVWDDWAALIAGGTAPDADAMTLRRR